MKRRTMGALPVMLVAAFGLATAGTAWAQPPTTHTEVFKLSESFSDARVVCQDELYTLTVQGHVTLHYTYFEETGAVHFHSVDHGHIVAVPLDGTGPSYTGNFRESNSANLRAVKHGDLLVVTYTDLNRYVARGSDGSRAFLKQQVHFTVNANDATTVQIETDRMVCT